LVCVVIAIWQQLAVGDTVAAQFISHYFSGLGSASVYDTLKKPLRGCAIAPILQVDIDHFTILASGTP
jgi:hypothetical protein